MPQNQIHGTFISFMASTKRKNQLFFKTSVPLQSKSGGSLRLYKLGMQGFQLCNECCFFFFISLDNQHFITVRNHDLVFSDGFCFKSFIGKYRLKYQIIAFFLQQRFFFPDRRLLLPGSSSCQIQHDILSEEEV